MVFGPQPVPVELASYVVQINLIHRPGNKINVLGSFNVWKKGASFGYADDLMRFCAMPGCLGLFDFTFTISDVEAERIKEHIEAQGHNSAELEGAVALWPEDIRKRHDNWYTELVACPKCNTLTPREMLCDTYVFNNTLDKIAERASDLYYELEADADLYLVRTKKSHLIHQANAELHETVKPDMGKYASLLEEARQREQVFYSNKQIAVDMANGGVLQKKILGFLRA